MNVLHVDSSILGERSVSRTVSAAVVSRLREVYPNLWVTYRDVVANPLPHLTASLAGTLGKPVDQAPAAIAPEAAALRRVLDEVLAADIIVVGTPMYNFGIPSQLKAWIDALAVPGKTFRYTDSGAEGLLVGKRLVIVSSQGGFYAPGTPMESFEHQESHLRSFFRFLGVTDIRVVRADGVKVGPESGDRVQAALRQAAELEVA